MAGSLKKDQSKIDPFLKNKPYKVGINNDSTGKFKIHPFGQDKAILKCVLK